MAMHPSPQRIKLVVTEVAVTPDAEARMDGEDHVVLEFAGKITPTFKRRIDTALMDSGALIVERRLAP